MHKNAAALKVAPDLDSKVETLLASTAREEIFGPVLCVIGYKDVDDAISIANDTDHGLAAYVQSSSEKRANRVAAQLEAGMVFVNGASEDPEAPFGGYKMSGN